MVGCLCSAAPGFPRTRVFPTGLPMGGFADIVRPTRIRRSVTRGWAYGMLAFWCGPGNRPADRSCLV